MGTRGSPEMGGAHTGVRVCICGSQRPVLGVVPQGLSTLVFFWQQWGGVGGGGGGEKGEDRVSHWNLQLTDWC